MAADTKEHILDAAERLFAKNGIDAVSLRTITTEARVNLAAVHYHFGSKEGLVEKVFGRRISGVNRERIEMLDAAEEAAGDGPLAVEDVLRALFTPALRLSREGEKGRMFMLMCGRIYAEPASFVQRIFVELFQDIVVRFRAAFLRALPDLPTVDRAWRVQFAVGAMAHTMLANETLKTYSGGVCDPTDVDAVVERIVAFAAAGLRAPASAIVAEPATEEQPVAEITS